MTKNEKAYQVAMALVQQSLTNQEKKTDDILNEIKDFRNEFKRYTCDNDKRVDEVEKDVIKINSKMGLATIALTVLNGVIGGFLYLFKR